MQQVFLLLIFCRNFVRRKKTKNYDEESFVVQCPTAHVAV